MALTLELILVVFANTVDLVRFLFFFTSATWAAAWEVAIFPAVYRVHRGAATLDRALCDAAGALPSLPTIDRDVLVNGKRWRHLHVRHVANLVAALVLVAQRCRAPVDAFAVLQNKM
jgi:hypothetical protein